MKDLIEKFKAEEVDVFLYAGIIDSPGYHAICNLLEAKNPKSKKVLLYLLTTGGDPNAAYRIARAMGHYYGPENFRVAVPLFCKSAGTLICVGASSLVFFDRGELGPLDIQFQKQDEIFKQSSGLDIVRGMSYIRKEALATFNDYLLTINSGSGLSTKTASEIASKLVIGLFEPIFAQVDPIRLGETSAALLIAEEYGNRLQINSKSLKQDSLKKLINDYPAHGFVIDRSEARKLFNRVEPPTQFEADLWKFVLSQPMNPGRVTLDILEILSKQTPTEAADEPSPDVGAPSIPAEKGDVNSVPIPGDKGMPAEEKPAV